MVLEINKALLDIFPDTHRPLWISKEFVHDGESIVMENFCQTFDDHDFPDDVEVKVRHHAWLQSIGGLGREKEAYLVIEKDYKRIHVGGYRQTKKEALVTRPVSDITRYSKDIEAHPWSIKVRKVGEGVRQVKVSKV